MYVCKKYMYIEVRLGVACTSYSDQDLGESKNLLDQYKTFAQTVDGKPLTYDRCVLEMNKAGANIQAAMDTDSIMNMFFAPPIHHRTPIIGPLVH
jgi:hypothetical protein